MARSLAACAVAICLLCGTVLADETDVTWTPPRAVEIPRPPETGSTHRIFRNGSFNWRRDPMIELAGGWFTFTPRLDMFFDYQTFFDDGYVAEGGRAGRQQDGFTVNRFRLGFDGKVGKHTKYRFTYELASQGDIVGFAQGERDVRDCYLDFGRLHEKWGAAFPDIRIGVFQEPFGLENTRSHHRIQFMTRAATDVFRPGRSKGIALRGEFANDRFSYRVGAFVNTQVAWNFPSESFGTINTDRDGFNVVGRVVWSPTGNDCPLVAQFGASYVHAWGTSQSRFRSRPENRAADNLIDTSFSTDAMGTPLLADTRGVDIVGAEMMLLRGRWMLQTEGFAAAVDSPAGGDPLFGGTYAYVSCILTGEKYVRKNSDARRVSPRCPWDAIRHRQYGHGALEAGVRYTYVNLDSGNVRGGTMNNVTVGLNWYASSWVRWQFNWVHSLVNDGIADTAIDILQMRLEFDW